jgi:hypothetical protein
VCWVGASYETREMGPTTLLLLLFYALYKYCTCAMPMPCSTGTAKLVVSLQIK